MGTWWLDERATYLQIRADAWQRLDEDREAGGDRRAFTASLRDEFDDHVTATSEKQSPCLKCGESWPCSYIRLVLAPD